MPEHAEDVKRAYARLFSTRDGQRVLAHLQRTVFDRVEGVEASDARLRDLNAQRRLLNTIKGYIDQGEEKDNDDE